MAGEIEVTDRTRELSRAEIDRIIMMAWEDRTSFDAIRQQFGLSPGEVIKLMRREMKVSSFKMWRQTAESLTVTTFEIEHIIPRSKGGETAFENLCLACPTCNRYKSDRLAEDGVRKKAQASSRVRHPSHVQRRHGRCGD